MARSRPSAAAQVPASPWLFNAPVDLLVGAGAWTIPLLGLTSFASRHAGIDVAFAFVVLTLVCNHPHYMATIHRAYTERDTLLRHRRYTIYLTALLLLTLVAAHVVPVLRPPIFSAYLFWSPWHYTGQNFGLALMFARRSGISTVPADRRLLFTGFAASYGVWLLSVQSQPSGDPYVLSMALDPRAANALATVLATVMLGAFSALVVRFVGRAGINAAAPSIVLCLTQLSWFVAPWVIGMAGGPTATSIYYTTGALAFMHCAQYLWVTTYYTRAAAQRTPVKGTWRVWSYACTLVLGGIALFIPGPWIASALAGVDLRESLIIFTAIVNLHHFVLDGALWKLRDRTVASVLVDSRGASRADATPRFAPVHPALRWGLAVALLAVAAADLCQRALTREAATSGAIGLAHALNPHDTRVDVRQAALLARASQDDAAIDLLRPIVAANPLHAPAQRLLGSLLLAEGRWNEASDHYEALARRGGLDAAGYVNLGVLRARADDTGAAEAAFRQALALDPDAADAHLNLAEALWRQDRQSDAVAHYEHYLADADPRDQHGQRVYLLAALKLAEAQAQAGKAGAAVVLLERTTRAAEHIEAWDLAVVGHAQAARLLEQSGDRQAAGPHYERAIDAAQRGGDGERERLLRARYEAYRQLH